MLLKHRLLLLLIMGAAAVRIYIVASVVKQPNDAWHWPWYMDPRCTIASKFHVLLRVSLGLLSKKLTREEKVMPYFDLHGASLGGYNSQQVIKGTWAELSYRMSQEDKHAAGIDTGRYPNPQTHDFRSLMSCLGCPHCLSVDWMSRILDRLTRLPKIQTSLPTHAEVPSRCQQNLE